MPDRFQRLRRLVEDALDVPAEARAAHLAAACGDDAQLLAEAQDLLATQVEDGFLTPAPSLAPQAAPAREAIGGFKILDVIGEGGMGVVYAAEQDVPRRRVALKVLSDRQQSPASLDRFRYEIEILGTLDHPGIAKVYDAGLTAQDGRTAPWFSMELIEDARPITEHADAEGLSARDRVALFLDVLDAVEHGHQRGVIHRDLKPDNVLVDGAGRAKVIDFGVARVADPELLEATLRTQATEMVGTLPYMSPEQVRGDEVDTRSDVYALGVLLFRLLTGELPVAVRGVDVVTAIQRIVGEPAQRARAVKPTLHGDLDAILGKALAKDPARRYRSAGALADDLRRHLEGAAVEARAPSTAYLLARFARRHKPLVAAAAIVLVTLVTAAAVSLGFALDSNEAEQEARTERARFERLYRTQFLQNVEFIARDAEAVAALPGGGPQAQRMIEDAVGRLETLEAEAGGSPEFQLQLADAYVRLSRSLGDLGRAQTSTETARVDALDRAQAIVDGVLAGAPDSAPARRQQIAIHGARAAVALSAGRFDDAAAHTTEALATANALGLPEDDSLVIGVHHLAALVGYRRGTLDEALAYVSRALKARTAANADDPVETRRLADDHRLRAELLRSKRRFGDAKDDLLTCLTIRRALLEDRPKHVRLRIEEGQTLLALGLIHMALGQGGEAARWYGEAHERLAALHAETPEHLGIAVEYARALQGLGQTATSLAIHAHPKGSAERTEGLRKALAHYERARAITADATRRRPDSANARQLDTQLQRQIAMIRGIVGR